MARRKKPVPLMRARLMADLQRLRSSPHSAWLLGIFTCQEALDRARKSLAAEMPDHFSPVNLAGSKNPMRVLRNRIQRLTPPSVFLISGIGNNHDSLEAPDNENLLELLNENAEEVQEAGNVLMLALPPAALLHLREAAPDIWAKHAGLHLIDETGEFAHRTPFFLTDYFCDSQGVESYADKQAMQQVLELLQQHTCREAGAAGTQGYHLLGMKTRLQYKMGDIAAAAVSLHQQRELLETLGDDQLLPEILNNMAMVCEAEGDFQRAVQYLENARKLGDKQFKGSNHPARAVMLANHGWISGELGDLQEAFLMIRRALRMCEKRLGMRHSRLIPILIKLGGVLLSQRHFEDALDCYRRALKIVERELTLEHPYTAAILQSIGRAYYAQGDFEAARRYIYRTLESIEKSLGPEHPYLAEQLNLVAMTHLQSGHLEWAEKYFEWAMNIASGAHSPGRLAGKILHNLARARMQAGDSAAAGGLLKQALERLSARLPEDHPDIQAVRASLSELERPPGDAAPPEESSSRAPFL